MKTIFSVAGLVCLIISSGMMVSRHADASDGGEPKITLPGIDYRKPAIPAERIPPPPIPVPDGKPPAVADQESRRKPAAGAHKYPESGEYPRPGTAPYSIPGPGPAEQGRKPKEHKQSGQKPAVAGAAAIIEDLFHRPVEDVIADNAPAILESVLGENKAEAFMERAPVIFETIDSILSEAEGGSDPLESIGPEIFEGISGSGCGDHVLSPEVEDVVITIIKNLPEVIEGISKPSKPVPGRHPKAINGCENPLARAIGGYVLKKIFETPAN